MNKPAAVACIVAMTLQGCATASKDIASSYTSPMQYQSFDCAQLNAEAQRIQARVVQLGGRLDQAANNDKALVTVGVILFWPALFALGGTKEQEAEYARLKGESDAVQQEAIAKKCPGAVAPAENVAGARATTPTAAQGGTAPASATTSPVSVSASSARDASVSPATSQTK